MRTRYILRWYFSSPHFHSVACMFALLSIRFHKGAVRPYATKTGLFYSDMRVGVSYFWIAVPQESPAWQIWLVCVLFARLLENAEGTLALNVPISYRDGSKQKIMSGIKKRWEVLLHNRWLSDRARD